MKTVVSDLTMEIRWYEYNLPPKQAVETCNREHGWGVYAYPQPMDKFRIWVNPETGTHHAICGMMWARIPTYQEVS